MGEIRQFEKLNKKDAEAILNRTGELDAIINAHIPLSTIGPALYALDDQGKFRGSLALLGISQEWYFVVGQLFVRDEDIESYGFDLFKVLIATCEKKRLVIPASSREIKTVQVEAGLLNIKSVALPSFIRNHTLYDAIMPNDQKEKKFIRVNNAAHSAVSRPWTYPV